ncbi:MAG: hypothetical protein R2865_03710 [Deinococcales bacterium]
MKKRHVDSLVMVAAMWAATYPIFAKSRIADKRRQLNYTALKNMGVPAQYLNIGGVWQLIMTAATSFYASNEL